MLFNPRQSLLCETVVDTVPETRSPHRAATVSKEALCKDAVNCITRQYIWRNVRHFVSQTNTFHRAAKRRWKNFLSLLEDKDDTFQLCWKCWYIQNASRKGRNTQPRTVLGQDTVLTLLTSLLRLGGGLHALPSRRLSGQSLAVSALWQGCIPSGNMLAAADEPNVDRWARPIGTVSSAALTCCPRAEERWLLGAGTFCFLINVFPDKTQVNVVV